MDLIFRNVRIADGKPLTDVPYTMGKLPLFPRELQCGHGRKSREMEMY